MRIFYLAVVLIFTSFAARAQQVDLSGDWSLVGDLSLRHGVMVVMPTCSLAQNGNQVTGQCVGTHSTCEITGVVRGDDIDLSCQTTQTDEPNVAGVFRFRGTRGQDHIIHGKWGHSRVPRARGYFMMVRL